MSTFQFYPWIGKNYYKNKRLLGIDNNVKLLVLGESHYADKDEILSKKFTVDVVTERVMDKDYEYPFFENISGTLIGKKREDIRESYAQKLVTGLSGGVFG